MDILLVDDSRVMRQLIRRSLRQAGCDTGQIVEAENGVDALDKLKAWTPDIVLCDWNMPEMTGIDLLTTLRERGNRVAFGFVTSESTPAMRARAAAAGALFLLSKPFSADDLKKALGQSGVGANRSPARVEPVRAAGGAAFSGPGLARFYQQAINVPVTAVHGAPMGPDDVVVSATWVDVTGVVRYAALLDPTLARALGGALGMRPAAQVLSSKNDPELAAILVNDARELLNMMVRAFHDAGSVHVRLGASNFPPAPRLPEAVAMDKAPGVRMDLQITVQGFGQGRLTLLSVNKEKFIADR